MTEDAQLSQDEIDALLDGVPPEADDRAGVVARRRAGPHGRERSRRRRRLVRRRERGSLQQRPPADARARQRTLRRPVRQGAVPVHRPRGDRRRRPRLGDEVRRVRQRVVDAVEPEHRADGAVARQRAVRVRCGPAVLRHRQPVRRQRRDRRDEGRSALHDDRTAADRTGSARSCSRTTRRRGSRSTRCSSSCCGPNPRRAS